MEKIKKKKGKQIFSAGRRSITICKTTSYKTEKIGKIQTYFKWEYGKEEGCADVLNQVLGRVIVTVVPFPGREVIIIVPSFI